MCTSGPEAVMARHQVFKSGDEEAANAAERGNGEEGRLYQTHRLKHYHPLLFMWKNAHVPCKQMNRKDSKEGG